MPLFPNSHDVASAFFLESIRHLGDAKILLEAERYPASIASSAKAAELSVKALYILEGAIGWWDSVFTTHSPLKDCSNHVLLKQLRTHFNSYRPNLAEDIESLESNAPRKPGTAQFDEQAAENVEYPYFYLDGSQKVQIGHAALRYTTQDAEFSFECAREAILCIHGVIGEALSLPIPNI